VLAVLTPLALAAAPACAEDAGYRGVDVFDVVCAGCHRTGERGAPKIGDRAAWAKRVKQGFARLTQHALDGIRNMPPHGGAATLSDLEVQRAIVYMVNKSGGNWVEPANDWELAGERDGAEIVQQQCALCHASGFGGAPRIGEHAAWVPRLALGLDRMVHSAMRGKCGMPYRGGAPNLTDAELRSATIYMASRMRTFVPASSGNARSNDRLQNSGKSAPPDIGRLPTRY
jgi:cytochrome c5